MALSQKFAVKLRTGAIVLNFAVIFVDVVGNGKQRDFCRNLRSCKIDCVNSKGMIE